MANDDVEIRPKPLDEAVRNRFLVRLAYDTNVTQSCAAAMISVQRAYVERRNYPEFAQAWDEAKEAAVDRAETEAWRRGVDGTERPIVRGGVVIGSTVDYSDRLLELVLTGRRKPVYGRKDQQVAITNVTKIELVPGKPEATTIEHEAVKQIDVTPDAGPSSRPTEPIGGRASERSEGEGD